MKGGLGNMPLTLFVIVAAIVLYLYLRRANLGIDLHPGEKALAPTYAPRPYVRLPGAPPVLPAVPPGEFLKIAPMAPPGRIY